MFLNFVKLQFEQMSFFRFWLLVFSYCQPHASEGGRARTAVIRVEYYHKQ